MTQMSMSTSGNGRNGRRQHMADINVTPMVDVMLVLLVIFMITAPILKEGIEVDLPKTRALPSGGKPTAVAVSVDKEGKVHAGSKVLDKSDLEAELPKILKGHELDGVTFKADRNLPYDTVMKVIAVIRTSGISQISMAVESR